MAGEDKKRMSAERGGCGGRRVEVEGIPLGKWLISKEEDECEGRTVEGVHLILCG